MHIVVGKVKVFVKILFETYVYDIIFWQILWWKWDLILFEKWFLAGGWVFGTFGYVPTRLSVPESPIHWPGCEVGMVLDFRGRSTSRLPPTLEVGSYSFSRDRPFVGPLISLTSNGGVTHGFYNKVYLRFEKWFWTIIRIWNLWNFCLMWKYVIYMIIRIVICIMRFDYMMTLTMKSDDKDINSLYMTEIWMYYVHALLFRNQWRYLAFHD